MSSGEQVYLNGEFVPHAEAVVPVEDRGFNFADSLYEVVRIVSGRGFRIEVHLDRLTEGARTLEIDLPLRRDELRETMLETARVNGVTEGTVYTQLTRGVAKRAHGFPEGARPTLVMFARPFAGRGADEWEEGVAAITAPDLRWGYCEVKTTGLLPNVIAYQHAHAEGAYEAILVRNGVVTEGSRSSVFCVRGDEVYTHPIDNILPGITRRFLIEALEAEGTKVNEMGVSIDEFRLAEEIFLTGTTTEVLPVTRLDGESVGAGAPGELTRRAAELYQRDLEVARGRGAE